MGSRLCACVQFVRVKCMNTESLHGEVIASWPHCGGKAGEQ